jgi:peptidoglycan L-alanyl-D-glutamate endopeptidase CwlK
MAKIDTLDPLIKPKVVALLAAAEAATGLRWVVTAARRTMADQMAIYAQGRTAPGKVVSNAPAGSSAHNYGLAADLAPLKADGSIWWGATRKVWQQMADEAVKLGLTSGFYFKTIFDGPHVEHPEWRKRRELWRAGKLEVP